MSSTRRSATLPAMTFDEAVSRVPFLGALPDGERERLRPYAEIRHVPSGENIWALHDPMHAYVFLIEGHAKMVRPCENGREVIVDVGGPAELLCSGPVTTFTPACCSCVAFDDGVMALYLPRRDILQMIERDALAAAAFVRASTGREMRLGQRISELAGGQVEQRVAALLLRLAEQNGSASEGGHVRIPLHLSRQDLADLCGTTLESAIRTMSRLSRQRIVSTAARGFVVIDRARLERLAREGPRRASPASAASPD